jgi:hypothetical protein
LRLRILICAVLCAAVTSLSWNVLLSFILWRDESWNIQEIEKYFQVSIPPNAQNLSYTSGDNRNVHVELSFSAPPKETLDFAAHFCEGVLHQGYDPFNAINVDEQTPQSVEIEVIEAYYTYSYFSYSPRTLQTKFGVYCMPRDDQYWILVDEANPSLYTLKLNHRASRLRFYIDAQPIANFPILVRGLMPELKGYSAHQQLCFDLDPQIMNDPSSKWNSLLGANLDISIDGRKMTAAYVTNDGRLARRDGKTNYSDPDSDLFKYCLMIKRGGWHTVTIQLPPYFIGNRSNSFSFRELYSESCGDRYPDNDCF